MSNDFLVTKKEVFISQRKTAEMVGISRYAIQKFISSSGIAETLRDGMLTPKTLVLVATHYAYVSKAKTEKALILLDKLMEAGAKAFILYSAGQQPVTHQQLEAKILMLEKQHTADLAKIIANPKPQAIKSRHEELMDWVEKDWLHVEKKQITKYVYTILDTQVLTKTKTGMIVKV